MNFDNYDSVWERLADKSNKIEKELKRLEEYLQPCNAANARTTEIAKLQKDVAYWKESYEIAKALSDSLEKEVENYKEILEWSPPTEIAPPQPQPTQFAVGDMVERIKDGVFGCAGERSTLDRVDVEWDSGYNWHQDGGIYGEWY